MTVDDTFDLAAMDAELTGTPFAGRLRFFPAIHSTNSLAMQEAEAGAPEGNLGDVVAVVLGDALRDGRLSVRSERLGQHENIGVDLATRCDGVVRP